MLQRLVALRYTLWRPVRPSSCRQEEAALDVLTSVSVRVSNEMVNIEASLIQLDHVEEEGL